LNDPLTFLGRQEIEGSTDHSVQAGEEPIHPLLAGLGRRGLRPRGLLLLPRPVLRPRDPDRAAKLRALRALRKNLPADETAVFLDEVEIHTNPKIGCMWMRPRKARRSTFRV
jgi:hypothetical protein